MSASLRAPCTRRTVSRIIPSSFSSSEIFVSSEIPIPIVTIFTFTSSATMARYSSASFVSVGIVRSASGWRTLMPAFSRASSAWETILRATFIALMISPSLFPCPMSRSKKFAVAFASGHDARCTLSSSSPSRTDWKRCSAKNGIVGAITSERRCST